LLIKADDRFETTRPTRIRPETITSWDRGRESRDQDQLLWDRDRDQKSGLVKWSWNAETIFFLSFFFLFQFLAKICTTLFISNVT